MVACSSPSTFLLPDHRPRGPGSQHSVAQVAAPGGWKQPPGPLQGKLLAPTLGRPPGLPERDVAATDGRVVDALAVQVALAMLSCWRGLVPSGCPTLTWFTRKLVGEEGFTIRAIEPGRLLLACHKPKVEWVLNQGLWPRVGHCSWLFLLEPLVGGKTRLIVWDRLRLGRRAAATKDLIIRLALLGA
jgi:hypothetical protein